MSRLSPGIAGGVLVGVLCAVAPVTLWAVALALLCIGAAAARLSNEERRVLFTICAIAVAVRVMAIAAMLLIGIPHHSDLATGALTGDEAYNLSRAIRSRDVLVDTPVTRYDYFVVTDEYGYSSYLAFLTWVQTIAGPTPYSLRLFNTAVFLAGALLLFRVARRAYGSVVAFTGLGVLLAVPSLAASSVSLLKEPLYFTASALFLWSVLEVIREGPTVWRRLGALMLIAILGVVLQDLRRGALLLAVSGVMLAIVMRLVLSRWWSVLAATAIAVVVAGVAMSSAEIRGRALSGLESAAKLHTGHVFTVGHAYKLLDAGFYVNPQATVSSTLTLTPEQAARFVLRGLVSFAVEPLPWTMATQRELLFLPELLLWYAVVALVPVGVWVGWRSQPTVTALLVGYVMPTAVVVALTTGNVGTLLRLRGLVLPYLLWLSVLGLYALLARLMKGREG
jgi:hypothetical protein